MRLYIIRHGETKLNALGCLQGWTDEPLNKSGSYYRRGIKRSTF